MGDIFYSWSNYSIDVFRLCDSIKKKLRSTNKKVFKVFGVSRGGLVPAVSMSHILNTDFGSIDVQFRDREKKINLLPLQDAIFDCRGEEVIIVVDDIVDSGKTFERINSLVCLYETEVWYYSLIKSQNCKVDIDVTYAAWTDAGSWVVFPWEVDELTR